MIPNFDESISFTSKSPSAPGGTLPSQITTFLAREMGDLGWQESALCSQTDPDAFFPERGSTTTTQDALAVCANCEVVAECLEYALENDEQFGVWGGTTEHQRRRMRPRRQTLRPWVA